MLQSLYIPVLLAIATLTMGYPSGGVPKPWEDDDGIQEIQILKRDAVLTASDMELAEKHGVDVNEGMAGLQYAAFLMGVTNVCLVFKHSIIKRADGDDVTIWVHRNFTEGEPTPEQKRGLQVGQPEKRAPAVHSVGKNWKPIGPGEDGQQYCYEKPLRLFGITSGVSPPLASVKELSIWGRHQSGFFAFGEFKPWVDNQNKWVNLVVAGKVKGTHARFAARWDQFGLIMLGPGDVSSAIDAVASRFAMKYGSTWRVAAQGSISCPQRISTLISDYGYGDIEFKIVRGG